MLKKLAEQIAEIKQLTLTEDEVKGMETAMQTKANEVEHTTNTGYGAELVPTNVLSDMIIRAIPTYSSFASAFSVGFHGNNMGASEKVAIRGEIGFAKGVGEWTTGAGALAQGNRRMPTDEVTITQYDLQISVDISKKLKNHSVIDIVSEVATDVAQGIARTIDSAILNADPNTSSAGNVNSDDQLFTTTYADGADDHRYLGYTGLRATAIAGTDGVDKKDIGTLSFADMMVARGQMGPYSLALNDLVLIMDQVCYNTSLTLTEFTDLYKNGQASTSVTGQLGSIAGNPLFIARDFPQTEADGKMSGVTPANNVKGGFLYVYKPAVQRGFGQELEIDIVKVPGKGYQVIATQEFGFAIVNKKAGETKPRVVLGYNVS